MGIVSFCLTGYQLSVSKAGGWDQWKFFSPAFQVPRLGSFKQLEAGLLGYLSAHGLFMWFLKKINLFILIGDQLLYNIGVVFAIH